MIDLDAMVAELKARLVLDGDPERARREKAYLKSSLAFYGASAPKVQRIVRDFKHRYPDLEAEDLRALTTHLWAEPHFELHSVAAWLLTTYRDRLEPPDLGLVEDLLRRSHTWALVDHLSTRVAGHLVTRYPENLPQLARWSQDSDFWIRRASLLALLPELRKGQGEWDLFCQLATPMVAEPEFFIRKAIGWVLREVSKKRPTLTWGYLAEQRGRVSGLTLREGAKHLPPAHRSALGLL